MSPCTVKRRIIKKIKQLRLYQYMMDNPVIGRSDYYNDLSIRNNGIVCKMIGGLYDYSISKA